MTIKQIEKIVTDKCREYYESETLGCAVMTLCKDIINEIKVKEQPPKWVYRLESIDKNNGLWYNGDGAWCFETGIGAIEGCKTKTLPMDYDPRYKQDGRDWFSSCSDEKDLLHWYSLKDAKKLFDNGFVFTRYFATEYHEYDLETVFIKETSLCREEIDIFDLFKP
jgi:hypothetical protein